MRRGRYRRDGAGLSPAVEFRAPAGGGMREWEPPEELRQARRDGDLELVDGAPPPGPRDPTPALKAVCACPLCGFEEEGWNPMAAARRLVAHAWSEHLLRLDVEEARSLARDVSWPDRQAELEARGAEDSDDG